MGRCLASNTLSKLATEPPAFVMTGRYGHLRTSQSIDLHTSYAVDLVSRALAMAARRLRSARLSANAGKERQ